MSAFIYLHKAITIIPYLSKVKVTSFGRDAFSYLAEYPLTLPSPGHWTTLGN